MLIGLHISGAYIWGDVLTGFYGKSIGIMKKLSLILRKNSLLTIYKTFVRSILDYEYIIYDKILTDSFKNKLKMVQYNAALVITSAIKGTSRDRINRELGLEYLAERRWFFHKIINGALPEYLTLCISYCDERVYQTRLANQNNLRQFSTRTKISEPSFFPYYIIKEWNNLTEELQKMLSTVQFKTNIFSFIRRKENLVFKVHDTNSIKILNHLI